MIHFAIYLLFICYLTTILSYFIITLSYLLNFLYLHSGIASNLLFSAILGAYVDLKPCCLYHSDSGGHTTLSYKSCIITSFISYISFMHCSILYVQLSIYVA